MASYTLELDDQAHVVMVTLTHDDDSVADLQFDFDARSGRWEFAERDLLEGDYGEEWVEELEEGIEGLISGCINK